MKNQKIMKIASVLLLSAVMLLSASAATANTTKMTSSHDLNIQAQGSQTMNRDVVWDNGYYTGNLLSSQFDTAYPFNSQVADDFQFGGQQTITEIIFWGGFWNGDPINPIDLNVIFYADDGTGNMPTGAGMADPTSTALLVDYHPAVLGTDNGDGMYTYDIVLNTPFDAAAGEKYWVACQWVGNYPPQWGWSSSDTQQMHDAMQGFPLLGYAYWIDPGYGDVAFQLLGGAPSDTTPPVTTCAITGTNPVTITLSATDDISGVAYTKYKIDDGTYATYTAPVVVSEVGDHTVYFYSADNAGNIEDEKSQAFTVEAPALTITIKGGLGVSATIKNTGATDLTNIDWSIALDGKMIFVGKTKSNTIASLAAGESVTVKDFVVGFGKTGIAVTAGTSSAHANGTALLIFVIGVK